MDQGIFYGFQGGFASQWVMIPPPLEYAHVTMDHQDFVKCLELSLGIADSRSLVSSNSKDSGGQIDMLESKGKKLF